MTKRQKEIYLIMTEHHAKRGYFPRASTLAIQLGIKHPTVLQHIDALVANGYLKRPEHGVIMLGDKSLDTVTT